jgi:hypothetical protein
VCTRLERGSPTPRTPEGFCTLTQGPRPPGDGEPYRKRRAAPASLRSLGEEHSVGLSHRNTSVASHAAKRARDALSLMYRFCTQRRIALTLARIVTHPQPHAHVFVFLAHSLRTCLSQRCGPLLLSPYSLNNVLHNGSLASDSITLEKLRKL